MSWTGIGKVPYTKRPVTEAIGPEVIASKKITAHPRISVPVNLSLVPMIASPIQFSTDSPFTIRSSAFRAASATVGSSS